MRANSRKPTGIKFVPEYVRLVSGSAPVTGVVAYLPNTHPKGCPLIPGCVAVELQTRLGSRWYGVERAWIGSDLRMRVSGFNPRFEEMAAWSDADAD